MLMFVPASLILVSAASAATSPYLPSAHPATSLFAIAETPPSGHRSNAELICLDSLAGNLARRSPRLYRVTSPDWASVGDSQGDSYATWLADLRDAHGVEVRGDLISAPLREIVAHFRGEVQGFVRCNDSDGSTSAAFTYAAGHDGVLLAPDEATAASLGAAGLPLLRDMRHTAVRDVLAGVIDSLSKRVFVFQDPVKSIFVGDYAVFARAPVLKFGSDPASQMALLARAAGPAVALGWGPENDFVSECNTHGVYVHASDYNKNLPVLSNLAPSARAGPAPEGPRARAAGGAAHTVAFLMSDGDNLQWTLTAWSGPSPQWFGSPARGQVPVGWTFSPAAAYLAPSILQHVVSRLTPNDELVAGPSGVGYAYPTKWPAAAMQDFANLTHTGMHRAGMRVINVLGQNDEPPSGRYSAVSFPRDLLSPLLQDPQVHGMVYYPWGGGYSALNGQAWVIDGKPVVSGRYSLWGNGTSGEMVGPAALVEQLKRLPKDPSKVDGYSLIPVNAWSHSYADILEVARGLQKAGGFDVVLPSELLRRLGASMTAESSERALQRALFV